MFYRKRYKKLEKRVIDLERITKNILNNSIKPEVKIKGEDLLIAFDRVNRQKP
jgi:hypothetical protein